MAYQDLVVIILTAVTAIVAALGVGVAVATFIGFNLIKRATIEAAKAAALEEAKKAALEEAKQQFTINKQTGRLPNDDLQMHISQAIEEIATRITLNMSGLGGIADNDDYDDDFTT